MALIRCPECGREISDKAAACPGCGYPMTPVNPETEETARRLEEANRQDTAFLKKATLVAVAAVAVMLVLVFVLGRGG